MILNKDYLQEEGISVECQLPAYVYEQTNGLPSLKKSSRG